MEYIVYSVERGVDIIQYGGVLGRGAKYYIQYYILGHRVYSIEYIL